MKLFLSLSALLFTTLLNAQPTWQNPPRLVVGIVVDQMRLDMLYREWDNFGDDGFKRLVREGSFQRDAHYNYVPTFTAPGHASIYTGTTPSRHGITANNIYDPALRRTVYSSKDTTVHGIGSDAPYSRCSPAKLLASTLADEMELRWSGASRTIGVSLKDRSAIMPIGRTGDASYWFMGGKEGNFITSSWYMNELPDWVKRFNAEKRPDKYLAGKWDLALPRARYHSPLPDDNIYEYTTTGAKTPTLPLDMGAMRKAGAAYDLIKFTPWGNTITTDMALAALENEQMGQDSIPDLLALSYSAPDESAHDGGQRSLELEDIYIRLDAELARVFNYLDQHVGNGNYTVFLTADHGGSDVPAYLRDLGVSAGYASPAELMGFLAQQGFGADVDTIVKEQLYLRPGTNIETANAVARELIKHPKIAAAASATSLREIGTADPVMQAALRGWMEGRSGDILFALKPGYMIWRNEEPEKGTEHGTAWNYDTHVPVIFMGQGIRHNEVLRSTTITDIVPTICALLGMALPNAANGSIVPEVLKSGD
ncbi:MAG: alkaline phosphatase family protein [Flavobacteriales bacterium]|jgi:predicted AlkP superfamily pyrophosphatase or phosphodiesterase|nr:alkaline phosphatase family protein [Flavobacteriales bacterium]